jgi:hypothetical protein
LSVLRALESGKKGIALDGTQEVISCEAYVDDVLLLAPSGAIMQDFFISAA